MIEQIEFNTALQHPFTCMVVGPTKAGKTELVKRIIRHASEMIEPAPKEILFCYTEWQPGYKQIESLVRFHEGPPPTAELKSNCDVPKLIIQDDMMCELKKDKTLVELFVRGCHHWNLSCIHIVQNAFFGDRTSRVNAQYLVLMKNPSDRLQVMCIARQLFPRKQAYFMAAYEDATEKPHAYLLLDMNQNTPDIARLRTNIFPGEEMVVYAPKRL